MLLKAKEKLAGPIRAGCVLLELADLSQIESLPTCQVMILNWSLQFVRPIGREQLLKKVYEALEPGGILLLSEKILAKDALLNRLYIDHYLQFKKSKSGYTDTENQRKREALENVLIPYRLDENYALLERAGFKHIDTYFQWFNFVCMIAIKSHT
jgi:tRNA (cmo5U34)-methyltransferase